MESRVARLETEFTSIRRDMDEIKTWLKDLSAGQGSVHDDLGSVRTDLAGLKAQVTEKPSRGFVIGTVIAIFGLCAGMVGGTVASLQYLQGLP